MQAEGDEDGICLRRLRKDRGKEVGSLHAEEDLSGLFLSSIRPDCFFLLLHEPTSTAAMP